MAIHDPSNMMVWKGQYQKEQIEMCNYVERMLVLLYKVTEGIWSKEIQYYIFMLVLVTSLYAVVQTQNDT